MDDATAFSSLFDANHSRVHALLARMVGLREAEDLTQVVFAKAAEALPRFRGRAQPSTWLYRIAANVGSDWLRSRAAREAKVTLAFRGRRIRTRRAVPALTPEIASDRRSRN
jgi:RNA polymerase sigma-70 factor, ECF subfamily